MPKRCLTTAPHSLPPLDGTDKTSLPVAGPTRRKTRWSTPPPRPSADTHAQPFRRRRPETTTLHRIVREHLETYLALANDSDPMGEGVPGHVEKRFRSYLRCGILAHGFARARCATCGYDFLVAFSCKGRGACPSCNAKRMAETAAHSESYSPRCSRTIRTALSRTSGEYLFVVFMTPSSQLMESPAIPAWFTFLDSDSPAWGEVSSSISLWTILVSSLVTNAQRVISIPVAETAAWALRCGGGKAVRDRLPTAWPPGWS